jgi:hypothetical protein
MVGKRESQHNCCAAMGFGGASANNRRSAIVIRINVNARRWLFW